MRTSYSLNRINEIHETELTDNEEEEQVTQDAGDNVDGTQETVSVTGGRSRRQFTPQLSSESEGEPPGNNEILTRYNNNIISRRYCTMIQRDNTNFL